MSLLNLFFIFVYIGAFAIGGGMVAATFMKQALCDQYALITSEKFYSMLAISESTPGPIGINIATYIGTELYGIPGAIVCTFGEVLPSLIVIILIARFFARFQENKIIKNIFTALRPATTGMILSIFINLFIIAVLQLSLFKIDYDFHQLINWPAFVIFIFSFMILKSTKLHPVAVIFMGAVLGIIFL